MEVRIDNFNNVEVHNSEILSKGKNWMKLFLIFLSINIRLKNILEIKYSVFLTIYAPTYKSIQSWLWEMKI